MTHKRKPGRPPSSYLVDTHPDAAAQFAPERNEGVDIAEIGTYSHMKLWWRHLGDDGVVHYWTARPYQRASGSKCAVCDGKQVQIGVNDLATRFPDVATQWHPIKNGSVTPQDVSWGSNKPHWWLCGACGHEWRIFVRTRTYEGRGCQRCAGQAPTVGVNDLATTRPDVAARWHPTRNGERTPREVMTYSNRLAWWLCDIGHDYEAMVYSLSAGQGCGYCANRLVLPGYNDLASQRPDIAADWHPTKNEDVAPDQITVGSDLKAWWLGANCGHTWRARVYSRTTPGGSDCPKCHASGPEKRLFVALGDVWDDTEHDVHLKVAWGKSRSARIDIAVPSRTLVVEYDGAYWHGPLHPEKAGKDTAKTLALLDAGFSVVRVRENDLEHLDIAHPRLLQVNHRNDAPLDALVETISTWADRLVRTSVEAAA